MMISLHCRRGRCIALAGFFTFSSWGLGIETAAAQEAPAAIEAQAAENGVAPVSNVLAQFTTGVENREPVDQVTFVENGAAKIYFFSDLRNLEDQVVTHRWSYQGETVARVDFQVRGPRWRVWSTKELRADLIGDWTVEIVTESGEVIAAETFTHSPPND
jgi:hypothetical protein